MNITPETDGYLSVHEGSEVVDRQPDRLAAHRIGDDVDSVFQPVRDVPGGSLSGHGFHAQLGEGLVMDDEGMVIASVAATLGHDDRLALPFRCKTSQKAPSGPWIWRICSIDQPIASDARFKSKIKRFHKLWADFRPYVRLGDHPKFVVDPLHRRARLRALK